ncbi:MULTISPECIES: nitroreductase/quinone reductase family protein [Amycolatopsis]|uniref:nitroreductase/quinone reductase family protein n=1 Tax=Amycolatopsis TaxID=1813 RepID=UPI0007E10F08|nr:nitroreductase/quinone reductase family protein [Amycolatopsis sp. M39]MYW92492.1 nitroreductase family deazaflavin-dependent oxidoreductase [Amycolatopsis rubida]OAP26980.1 Deazaflavin-dependent nitroreductase [Amycolatopsis sp. M39]
MSDVFSSRLIAEFRANRGALGGRFEGWPLAVLTTTGARTGLRREVLLGWLEIEGNGVVVASANGADRHPAWYHNIRRNPMVTVEAGGDAYQAMAAIPRGAAYERLFAQVVAKAPGYGDYQAKTTREIPVVVLHRIDKRGKGMGDWLVEVHQWFRAELRALREQADDLADGSATALVRPEPDLAHEMRTHCLGFCTALRRHHLGEDSVVFPSLAEQFPALAPAIAQLAGQHEVVARLQDAIRQLVDGFVPGESDPVRLRAELERLAGEVEAHFEFEEQTVVTALNATAAAPPTA